MRRAGIAVDHPIDRAVPVVGDEERAVLHHRDVDRPAEVGIVRDEAGEERLNGLQTGSRGGILISGG